MMKLLLLQFWLLSGSVWFWLSASASPATAEITPDATLPENSSVNRQENVIQINRGTRRGDNLFHSFEQFSVPLEHTAFFNNAAEIQNIFTRITGNLGSKIDGTIRANGAANLFLINPNGIVFGENASLNIGGSFLASTATSIVFPNEAEFSATDPQAPPMLTVDVPVPIGLKFEGMSASSIANRSIGEFEVGLEVHPEKTLALVGGDVALEGGILTAPSGRVELGSVAGSNLVTITPVPQGFALSYEEVENFQKISLSQAAFVDTSGDQGGTIQIQGGHVSVTEGSQIFSATFGEGQGANVKVRASELLEVSGEDPDFGPSGIFAEVGIAFDPNDFDAPEIQEINREITGNGGDLSIETGSSSNAGKFIIQDGAVISTTTFGKGDAGDLNIITGQLIVRSGGQVQAATSGEGEGGSLTVRASEFVDLKGTLSYDTDISSGLFTDADSKGNAGNLTLETGQLTVTDGAQIATTARNGAQGGNLTVNAKDSILLSGTAPDATLIGGQSGIFVSSEPAGVGLFGGVVSPGGDSGNLLINTPRLTVEDGAKISADTFGPGEGGNATLNVNQLFVRDGGLVRAGSLVEKGVSSRERGPGGTLTIKAAELVEVSGTGTVGDREIPVNSQLFTAAEGTGDAGDLSVTTERLTVRDGGEVTASTSGAGEGGNITLNVRESINLEGTGSGIFASTGVNSSGDGGSIFIDPETVIIRDGASIAVDSEGIGQGGNIALEAGTLTLDRGAITAETASTQGGNVTLQVQDILFLEDGSTISATAGTAQAGGDGGNITIESDFIVADPNNNSDITANAFTGRGGQVTISAEGILGIEERDRPTTLSDITATSEFGVAGVVEIETPEVDPNRALAALPDTPDEVELAQGCQADDEQGTVAFFNIGRGGLPPRPDEPLRSETIITPWVGLTSEEEDNLDRALQGIPIISKREAMLFPNCRR